MSALAADLLTSGINIDDQRGITELTLKAIDLDLVSQYIAEYLSDPSYVTARKPEWTMSQTVRVYNKLDTEQLKKTGALIDNNPALKNTFATLSEIMSKYFNDLLELANVIEPDIHSIDYMQKMDVLTGMSAMQREAEKGFFATELLPFMVHGIEDDVTNVGVDADLFQKAFQNAMDLGVFSDERRCPFSRRLASILALSPSRDEGTGQISFAHTRSPFALLAFIHKECSAAEVEIPPASNEQGYDASNG